MKYELTKFGGEGHEITIEQYEKLKSILLPTGKFVEVNDNLINISEIKSITKGESPKKEFNIDNI